MSSARKGFTSRQQKMDNTIKEMMPEPKDTKQWSIYGIVAVSVIAAGVFAKAIDSISEIGKQDKNA